MKKFKSTFISRLLAIFFLCVCIFTASACSPDEQKPYYGTYQPIGAGSEIVINQDSFTLGQTAQYTYDEYNKEIYIEQYDLKFKLFNNYTILALTDGQVGGWTSFDFEDYGDGTVYLRCVRLDSDYKLKELLTVNDDGTFSYFSSPYTTIDGTYRYKDRFIKFSSDVLSYVYVAYDKTLYMSIWIKDYQNFWDNYSKPDKPIEPDDSDKTPQTATVQFIIDNEVYKSETVAINTTITEPPTVSKPHYMFLGWYKDNTKIEFPYTVTSSVAFVAKWQQLSTYTCIFVAEQGGNIDGKATQNIEEGTTAEPITATPNKGYEFLYWKYTVFGIDSYYRTPTITIDSEDFQLLNTSSITYTAVFKKITYAANYNCTGGYSHGTLKYNSTSNYTASFEISIDNNFSAPQITAVPNQGYQFVKWSDGITTATRHDTNINSDINITAQFVRVNNIAFVAETGGTIVGNTNQTIGEGEKTSAVIAVANDGYEFLYWKYTEYGTDLYYSTPTITINSEDLPLLNTSSITYTAVFKKITYAANYDCTGGYTYGTLKYNSTSNYTASFEISIDNNFSAPQITAVPNQGYRFVKWSDGITTATRHDTNINSDINITAQFVRVNNITFVAETGGTIVGNTNQTIDEGEKTSAVTAVANDGYEFLYWKYTEYGSDFYYWTPTITIDSEDLPLLNTNSFTYTAVFKSK